MPLAWETRRTERSNLFGGIEEQINATIRRHNLPKPEVQLALLIELSTALFGSLRGRPIQPLGCIPSPVRKLSKDIQSILDVFKRTPEELQALHGLLMRELLEGVTAPYALALDQQEKNQPELVLHAPSQLAETGLSHTS